LDSQVAAAPPVTSSGPPKSVLARSMGNAGIALAPAIEKQEARADTERIIKTIKQPETARLQTERLDATAAENDKKIQARKDLEASKQGAAILPEHEDALEKAVADGRLDPYKVNSRNRSYYGRMAANNPTLNFNDLAGVAGADRATELEYSPKGIAGRSVRSINTTINHLDTLTGLGTALKNGDVQVLNRIGNYVTKELGGEAPTNFESAKQIVAAEIIKSIVPGGGGVTERTHLAEQIASASSPEQLEGFIRTAKELMKGQLVSLEQAYTRGEPDRVTRFRARLSPETAKSLEVDKPAVLPKSAEGAKGETKTYKGVTYRLKPGAPRNQQSSWEIVNG